MTDILYGYEDILLEELNDIAAIKKNGAHLSEQDICNGEKILKSIEAIERIVMLSSVDPEEYEVQYGARSYSNGGYNANYNGNGYNRSNGGANYGNNYSRSNSRYSRRYGHDENEFRAEVEKRMNMAHNEQERAVYANWLNEMDNRR